MKFLYFATYIVLLSLLSFSCKRNTEPRQQDNPKLGNLLKNPGFEDQLNHWSADSTVMIRTSDPEPHEGAAYIYGSKTFKFKVSQTIDLEESGLRNASLDAENWAVKFGGFQAGCKDQLDSGAISLVFLDSEGKEIDKQSLPSFHSSAIWAEQSRTAKIPRGSRRLVFEFIGERHGRGNNNDAYLDSTYLEFINPSQM